MDETSRLIPWSLELQLYNFKESHKPERLTLKAYSLSRQAWIEGETHTNDTFSKEKLGGGGGECQGDLLFNINVKAP